MAAPIGEAFTASDLPGQMIDKQVPGVLDLSRRGLLRIEPDLFSPGDFHTLLLDQNQIIKLEHLQLFHGLQQLSVVGNRLVRMSGAAGLQWLRVLDLRGNSIGIIEGLKDLTRLQWLNLAGNNIKVIEQLHHCISLQHLDLSNNNISHIANLPSLSQLQTLLLHGNMIASLRSVPAHLPPSLSVLSVSENEIRDLSEVSYLSSLPALTHLSLTGNPCVSAATSLCCDHRPFVLSVCGGLKQLDGHSVTHSETLTADWLRCQSIAGVFGPGRHTPLLQHLTSVCPLTTADTKPPQDLTTLGLHQIRPTHLDFLSPLRKNREEKDDVNTLTGGASNSTEKISVASHLPPSYTKDIQEPLRQSGPEILQDTFTHHFSPKSQQRQLMERSPLQPGVEQREEEANGSPEGLSEQNVAAVKIQSWWRGTRTRLLDPASRETRAEIRLRRLQQHIVHLNTQLHRVRQQQEEERQHRRVQEEAIKFLWKQLQLLMQWKDGVEQHLSDVQNPIEHHRISLAPSGDSISCRVQPASGPVCSPAHEPGCFPLVNPNHSVFDTSHSPAPYLDPSLASDSCYSHGPRHSLESGFVSAEGGPLVPDSECCLGPDPQLSVGGNSHLSSETGMFLSTGAELLPPLQQHLSDSEEHKGSLLKLYLNSVEHQEELEESELKHH